MGRTPETGEERLIAKYFAPLARNPAALGLTDDAAALTPPAGCDLVLSKDVVVAGVHFFPDDPADAVACKALRVNLSDLAAKGAAPAGFLLGLALPDSANDDWLKAFATGLGADANTYACPLLGGDTVRTPGPVTVSVTVVGYVPKGRMIRRNGAKAGDRIIVTGTIGDAALGLKLRQSAEAGQRWKLDDAMRRHLLGRYLLPQPRNAVAGLVQEHASAAMDVSDGLAGDLAKLCRVSGVGAEVAIARLPLSDAANAALKADPALIQSILAGGDDYEILCTVPPEQSEAFIEAASDAAVPATEIGHITAGEGTPRIIDANGKALELSQFAFSHF